MRRRLIACATFVFALAWAIEPWAHAFWVYVPFLGAGALCCTCLSPIAFSLAAIYVFVDALTEMGSKPPSVDATDPPTPRGPWAAEIDATLGLASLFLLALRFAWNVNAPRGH